MYSSIKLAISKIVLLQHVGGFVLLLLFFGGGVGGGGVGGWGAVFRHTHTYMYCNAYCYCPKFVCSHLSSIHVGHIACQFNLNGWLHASNH